MELTDKQLEIATDWWATVIQNPKFDNLGDTGSFEEKQNMRLVSSLATALVDPISQDQIDTFKLRLADLIRESEHLPWIACDYHPDEILKVAAHDAGIPESNFPWKTIMWFKDGGVQVSYGYGAKDVELLRKDTDPC